MKDIDVVKESICPTCGMPLGTSHLVQLNLTLNQLLEAEGIHVDKIGRLVEAVTEEIIEVSKQISVRPTLFGCSPT